MQNQAPLFSPPWSTYVPSWTIFLKNIIEDRGSKYSVLIRELESHTDPQRQAKLFFHALKKDKFHAKATHNSYAWRCERTDGFIADGYFDDGEKWAGQCIVREMRKANILNWIIVVVRYYGWIKLEWDRFRHVIDASKHVIDSLRSKI